MIWITLGIMILFGAGVALGAALTTPKYPKNGSKFEQEVWKALYGKKEGGKRWRL
jgi:hypothetical protein